MKFALPLFLVAAALLLDGCTTLANRRDLYSPEKAHGPYNDKLANYEMGEISTTASHARVKNH